MPAQDHPVLAAAKQEFEPEIARLKALNAELVEALEGLIICAAQEMGLEADECVGGHFAPARAALAKAREEG